MSSVTPVTDRIISDVRYAEGVELVRDCGTGLTLGDAGAARRRAAGAKRNGNRADRAYWLGVVRELRTRRVVKLAARTLDVSPASDDPDAEICRHCRTRSDWHDALDGACPDDDCPHPYSEAADLASQVEPNASPLDGIGATIQRRDVYNDAARFAYAYPK